MCQNKYNMAKHPAIFLVRDGTIIIGDHPSDAECRINARVTPIYLLSGHGNNHKNELLFNLKICNNLSDASKFIMSTI